MLEVAIGVYDSYVNVFLRDIEGSTIFETEFYLIGEIVYVNEAKMTYLDFRDCIFTGYSGALEKVDEQPPAYPASFQIHTHPEFKLKVS